MHNSTKTTTFSVKKGHTCTTTLKQQHLVQKRSHMNIWCKEKSHMQNNTKTTTFSVKKGHTYTTTRKQQHLV